jgi:putative Holliday junction resolvase
MRYLGLDYGTKKIGLALSDDAGTMGFPYAVVPNTSRLAEELQAIIERKDIGAIVIGESRTLAGSDNPVAKAARALGEILERRSGIPVSYESEVYTSAEARRPPEKVGKTRAPKRRAAIDASAAALILTSYLTKHHGA